MIEVTGWIWCPICDKRYTSGDIAQHIDTQHQPKRPCSFPNCHNEATWTRKPGWVPAPLSPPGDVCDTHQCWQPL